MKNLKAAFILLVALAVVSLNGGLGMAGGDGSSGNPNCEVAATVGIEQLVADYYGEVRLTSEGWKFELWEPTEDEPSEIPGCLANNQNP